MNCIDCNKTIHPKSTRCIPCRNKEISRLNSGNRHKNWKGDSASYKTKHQKINHHFGKANKCDNKECSGKSTFYEWANISGEYKRDISDWKMMCHSCNQKMDYFRRYGNKCKSGHEYTKENTSITKEGKRQCRACHRKAY